MNEGVWMLDAQHMYAEWMNTCGGPSTALADVPSCFPTGTVHGVLTPLSFLLYDFVTSSSGMA